MPLPVYEKDFSAAEKGFISATHENLQCLKSLSAHFSKNCVRTLDRGFDANDYYRYFLKQGYRNSTGFRRRVKVAGSGGLCYTCVMGTWKSKNRHKYLLQYHIIFVCKYRKKLLMSKQISDDIKQFSYEICQKHKVIIRYMETDKGERCPVDICYDPTEMECRPIFITWQKQNQQCLSVKQ